MTLQGVSDNSTLGVSDKSTLAGSPDVREKVLEPAAGKRMELVKATLQGVSGKSTLVGGPNVREKVVSPPADA
jgi:hypothetical protein